MGIRNPSVVRLQSQSTLSSSPLSIPAAVDAMAQVDRSVFSRKRYYVPPVLLGGTLVISGFAILAYSCCANVMTNLCYCGTFLQAVGISILVCMVVFKLPRYYADWRKEEAGEITEKRKIYLRDLVSTTSSDSDFKLRKDSVDDVGSYIRFFPDIETSRVWQAKGYRRSISGLCNDALSQSVKSTDDGNRVSEDTRVAETNFGNFEVCPGEKDCHDELHSVSCTDQCKYSQRVETETSLDNSDAINSSFITVCERTLSPCFCETPSPSMEVFL